MQLLACGAVMNGDERKIGERKMNTRDRSMNRDEPRDTFMHHPFHQWVDGAVRKLSRKANEDNNLQQ
jgi:hypothetical protein